MDEKSLRIQAVEFALRSRPFSMDRPLLDVAEEVYQFIVKDELSEEHERYIKLDAVTQKGNPK